MILPHGPVNLPMFIHPNTDAPHNKGVMCRQSQIIG